MTAGTRAQLRHGFAAELRRVRGDALPWAFLPLAGLGVASLAVSLVASLPQGLRSAPASAVEGFRAELSTSAFSGLLVITSVLVAVGVTLADRGGVLARDQLFCSAGVVFAARAISMAFVSALFGLVSVLLVEATFLVATGAHLLSAETATRTIAAFVGAGIWGYLVGVLTRKPILVLFIVPATLMPAMLLAEAAPTIAAAAMVAWILALGIVAALSVRYRDRL